LTEGTAVQQSVKEIEHHVRWSLLRELAVSIKLKDRTEAIIACITNFMDIADPPFIEIAPYTLYGDPIENIRIQLDQIEKVSPLSVSYSDPMYVRLREAKEKFLKKDTTGDKSGDNESHGRATGLSQPGEKTWKNRDLS
jgi:hypothetical protein